MNDFESIIYNAINLIITLDVELVEIVILSLKISLSALLISIIVSLPVGSVLAISKFFGRKFLIVTFNSLMGLPPVFVGLVLYLVFSANGPFGVIEILYTPYIMIIAQVVLILPIMISLSRQIVEQIYEEYSELFSSLNANGIEKMKAILWDGRYQLVTAILAGLGRALSEVGAIIIVGGNIAHVTRVMTTTIALETSKGNLELATALGLILLIISMIVNLFIEVLKSFSKKISYD